MKKKQLVILVLVLGIIIALIYGINWTKRFFQIDACIDKGGKWNYELGECEYIDQKSEAITKFYWHIEYDSLENKEFLIKGELIDSIGSSPDQLVEILNNREAQCKIELIEIINDTIQIKILNDEFLTERMGSTGAYCFLGETVFTLTENDLIRFVKIEMNYGSHASPGIYSRGDFKDLIIN